MAKVRVFMPTFRRPALLPRALHSLQRQSFTDWVCEVHNDDPKDDSPVKLIATLDDHRIKLHHHERNLGAIATFNLFYRPTKEPYYALLEDDNWWEPAFLQTMVDAMDAHSEIQLAWCNQKIWEELPDSSWRNTGLTVNPVEPETKWRLVDFGCNRQAMGALHSNGAMLMRSVSGQILETPADWSFSAVEMFRERMIPHPLLYITEPLGKR